MTATNFLSRSCRKEMAYVYDKSAILHINKAENCTDKDAQNSLSKRKSRSLEYIDLEH